MNGADLAFDTAMTTGADRSYSWARRSTFLFPPLTELVTAWLWTIADFVVGQDASVQRLRHQPLKPLCKSARIGGWLTFSDTRFVEKEEGEVAPLFFAGAGLAELGD